MITPFHISKTFPGCKSDFSGYPLVKKDEEMRGVKYMACFLSTVSKKMFSKSSIYQAISKLKEQDIIVQLYKFIKKYVMKTESILGMVSRKMNYDQINEDMGIETNHFDDFAVNNNIKFQPSIVQIQTQEEFNASMITTSLKNLNIYDYHGLLRDYIGAEVKGMEKSINEYVQSERPVLFSSKNVPYLINGCCRDGLEMNTLTSLLQESPSANEYRVRIQDLADTLVHSKTHSNLKVLKTIRDQRLSKTNIDDTTIYDKDTIYQGMIKLLNFDTSLEIPAYLQSYSLQKPVYLEGNNQGYSKTMNLQEKITVLESQGYSFTHNMFMDIMSLYFKHVNEMDSKESSESIVLSSNETDESFADFMGTKVTENRNVETLTQQNITKIRNSFVENDSKQKIDAIFNYFGLQLQRRYTSSDLINMIQTCKQMIYLCTFLYFPHVLIQNMSYSFGENMVCRHWNLSQNHIDDIIQLIKKQTQHISSIQQNPEFYESLSVPLFQNKIKKYVNEIDSSHKPLENKLSELKFVLSHIYDYYFSQPRQNLQTNILNFYTAMIESSYMLVANKRLSYNEIERKIKIVR